MNAVSRPLESIWNEATFHVFRLELVFNVSVLLVPSGNVICTKACVSAKELAHA